MLATREPSTEDIPSRGADRQECPRPRHSRDCTANRCFPTPTVASVYLCPFYVTPPSSLSPLRARLCSRENAIRVAQRMMQAGIAVMIAPGDAIQPWRVIERADLTASEVAARIALKRQEDLRCPA